MIGRPERKSAGRISAIRVISSPVGVGKQSPRLSRRYQLRSSAERHSSARAVWDYTRGRMTASRSGTDRRWAGPAVLMKPRSNRDRAATLVTQAGSREMSLTRGLRLQSRARRIRTHRGGPQSQGSCQARWSSRSHFNNSAAQISIVIRRRG